MNAPVNRPRILDAAGEALSPVKAWRALLESDQARPVAPSRPADSAEPAHPIEPVGRQARRLFKDLALYDRPRHPRTPLLHVPVLRQLALTAHAAYCLALLGGAVRRRFGRARWRQALDMAGLAWRERLDAQTYYMQELYRPDGGERAARTLTRFETKNGLFTALKRLTPRRSAIRSPLGDKLAFHDRCQALGIATVPILLSAQDGSLDRPAAFAHGEDLFIKPRYGKGARGAAMLQHVGEAHYRDGDGRIMTADDICADLARRSLEMPYLLQPRFTNHADIADLATDSLLVVRVITCLDSAGHPSITHSMLRVIGKLEPSWNDATEYAAPIDLATGRMGAMTGDKLGEALLWHDRHPLTQKPVTGRILAAWPAVREAALAAHSAFTDRLLLGWDIAITPQGVVVIEGNAMPDFAFLQRVHRQPIGDSPLGPLLQDHLQRLEMAEP